MRKIRQYLNYAVLFIVSLSWQPSELTPYNFYAKAYETHGITRKVWDYTTKVKPENKVGVLISGQPILANHPEIDGIYDNIIGNYKDYNNVTVDTPIADDLVNFYKNYVRSHEMMVATVLAAKPDNGGAAGIAWNSVKILSMFDVNHINNRQLLQQIKPDNCLNTYFMVCVRDVFEPLNYRIINTSYVYSEMNIELFVKDIEDSGFIVLQAVNNFSGEYNYYYRDGDGVVHTNPMTPTMYASNVIYVTGNNVSGQHHYSSGYIKPSLPIRQMTANSEITYASSTVDLVNNPWEKGEISGGVSAATPLVASALALGISLCPEASNLQHIDWLFEGAKESDIPGIALLYVEGYINVVERECQLEQTFAFPLIFGCTGECADLPKN